MTDRLPIPDDDNDDEPDDDFQDEEFECEYCDGAGDDCDECGGTGWLT